MANLEGMDLPAAGVAATGRGLLPVNADLRTTVPVIYAVGDGIGTPSLASSVMGQG